MIITKTEIFVYLDNDFPEKLLLPFFPKKIRTKAAKKSATKKSTTKKAAGKKRNCGLKTP